MLRQTVIAFSLSLLTTLPAFAAVPYTFTNGTPANASEINANFAALQAQIDALQAGPTMASLAGTYNIVTLTSTADSSGAPTGFSMRSEVGMGTVTLNADGTGSVNTTNTSTELQFSQSPLTVLTDMNIFNGSFIDGVTPVYQTVQGTSQLLVASVPTHSNTAVSSIIPSSQGINNIIISSNNNSSASGDAFTWSVSGNVVTVNAGNALTFSVAGKILVGADLDQLGNPDGLNILVHQ